MYFTAWFKRRCPSFLLHARVSSQHLFCHIRHNGGPDSPYLLNLLSLLPRLLILRTHCAPSLRKNVTALLFMCTAIAPRLSHYKRNTHGRCNTVLGCRWILCVSLRTFLWITHGPNLAASHHVDCTSSREIVYNHWYNNRTAAVCPENTGYFAAECGSWDIEILIGIMRQLVHNAVITSLVWLFRALLIYIDCPCIATN